MFTVELEERDHSGRQAGVDRDDPDDPLVKELPSASSPHSPDVMDPGGDLSLPTREDRGQSVGSEPIHAGQTAMIVRVSVAMSCLSSLLLGFDIGVMSGASIFIRKQFHLTTVQTEVLVGVLNLIASVGAILGGSIADRLGRKKTMFTGSLLFFGGTFFMVVAESYGTLLFGRIVTGVAIGVGLLIAPLYSAEIAPARYRGFLVCGSEIFITLGVLLGYVVNAMYQDVDPRINWRLMLGMGLIPPLFIQLSLCYIPETPRWLSAQGRESESIEVLKKIYNGDEDTAEKVHKDIVEAIAKDKAENRSNWRDIFHPTPILRSMLVVGIGVPIFQQATGIEAVTYYSPEILEATGSSDHRRLIFATVLFGTVKLSFILLATFLMDRVGRRVLLIASSTGLSVALFCLVFSSHPGSSSYGLSVFALCLFTASFSLGFGPVTWVLASEIYPSPIRGRGMSISTFSNRILSGTIAMTFLSVAEALTPSGAFLVFAIISVISGFWVYKYVPETKEKSLEQIEDEFKKQLSSRGSGFFTL